MADAYRRDDVYVATYQENQEPWRISLEARLIGQPAPDHKRPFRYADFGCGSGLTLLTLAAAFPQSRFYGVDFNAAHIEIGQRMAREAGLRNIQFFACGVEEIPEGAIPPCDYISAYGVMTWVAPDIQQALRQAVVDHLKPDGLFQFCANLAPGWSQMAPVRKLLQSFSAAHGAQAAAQTVQALLAGEEKFAQMAPMAKMIAGRWDNLPVSYLTHEYLNPDWNLFSVGELLSAHRAMGMECVGPMYHEGPQYKDLLTRVCPGETDPFLREDIVSAANMEALRVMVFKRAAPPLTREDFDISGDDVHGLRDPRPIRDAAPKPLQEGLTERGRAVLGQTASIQGAMDRLGMNDEETQVIIKLLGVAMRRRAMVAYAEGHLDIAVTADAAIRPYHDLTPLLLQDDDLLRRGVHLPSPVLGGGIRLEPALAALLWAHLDGGPEDLASRAQARLDGLGAGEAYWVRPENAPRPAPAAASLDSYRQDWLPWLGRMGVVLPQEP